MTTKSNAYITRKQAAAELGINEDTVTAWIKKELLVGKKLGTSRSSPWRISVDSIEKLLGRQ